MAGEAPARVAAARTTSASETTGREARPGALPRVLDRVDAWTGWWRDEVSPRLEAWEEWAARQQAEVGEGPAPESAPFVDAEEPQPLPPVLERVLAESLPAEELERAREEVERARDWWAEERERLRRARRGGHPR